MRSSNFLPIRISSQHQVHKQTECEKMENDIQANGIWKQASIAILVSNKRPQVKIRRDKEGTYILIIRIIYEYTYA
jgi:hypothetical protein